MPYIGGLYTGLRYIPAQVDTPEQVTALDEYLEALVDANQQESVVSIVMFPTSFISTGTTPAVQTTQISMPNTVGGYTPRNNKLFTYPYNFLCVDSLNDTKNYRYEWSLDRTVLRFSLYCGMSPNPEIVCTPLAYNGSEGATLVDSEFNWTESISCSGFPQCAFTIDAFRAWLAQKAGGEAMRVIGGGVGLGASLATGNAVGATLSAVGLASALNSAIVESTQGSRTHGSQGSSTEVSCRAKGFYFKKMSITAEFARMIDDFFDRYGYATNRIKVPNRNVRAHWTYTKTKDVAIAGDIPVDSMRKIKQIYDNGITFWRNGNEVGNYSLDNRYTGGS